MSLAQNIHAWVDHVEVIHKSGSLMSPRGKPSMELLNAHITIDMDFPAMTLKSRRASYSLMFAEAYWILSGSNKLKDIVKWCPRMKEFSDNKRTLTGAYGPRFRSQAKHVAKAITNDHQTRQAVMTLWNRCPKPSKDIPCTISLQFLLRDAYLHCIVNMRSSDAWLGLPYDIFSFTMMAQYVRMLLPTPINGGMLHINMGSAHLYESDWEKAEEMLKSPKDFDKYPAMDLYAIEHPDNLLAYLRHSRDNPCDFLS